MEGWECSSNGFFPQDKHWFLYMVYKVFTWYTALLMLASLQICLPCIPQTYWGPYISCTRYLSLYLKCDLPPTHNSSWLDLLSLLLQAFILFFCRLGGYPCYGSLRTCTSPFLGNTAFGLVVGCWSPPQGTQSMKAELCLSCSDTLLQGLSHKAFVT